MESERAKLERIIKNMSRGQKSDDRLFFDNGTKTIRTDSLPNSGNSDRTIEITPDDLTFAGA